LFVVSAHVCVSCSEINHFITCISLPSSFFWEPTHYR